MFSMSLIIPNGFWFKYEFFLVLQFMFTYAYGYTRVPEPSTCQMKMYWLNVAREEISTCSRYTVYRMLLYSFTKQLYVGVRESTYVSCPIFPPCSWSWITDAKALCRRCMGCLYFVSDLPLHLKEDILIKREPKFLSSAGKAPLVK